MSNVWGGIRVLCQARLRQLGLAFAHAFCQRSLPSLASRVRSLRGCPRPTVGRICAVLCRLAVAHIAQLFPGAPLLAAGFSIGANVLVHYLAEEADARRPGSSSSSSSNCRTGASISSRGLGVSISSCSAGANLSSGHQG